MAAIGNLVDFRRLMRAACLRLGTTVNQTELGRDTRIPRATVQRYLDLLETSYQLVRLEPYSVNRTKRLVKTPKLYWSDPALARWLSGAPSPSGAHLEDPRPARSAGLAGQPGPGPRGALLGARRPTSRSTSSSKSATGCSPSR